MANPRETPIEISKEQAREFVYGMPYGEWKDQFQTSATSEEVASFEKVMSDPNLTS